MGPSRNPRIGSLDNSNHLLHQKTQKTWLTEKHMAGVPTVAAVNLLGIIAANGEQNPPVLTMYLAEVSACKTHLILTSKIIS